MRICPEILRQRLLIEGIFGVSEIQEATVRMILDGLTRCLGMTPITNPLIFSPDHVSTLHHGIGGFQAWAESGCSLYTWRERRLFTLDIYSCRRFDPGQCLHYVDRVLQPIALDWRQV